MRTAVEITSYCRLNLGLINLSANPVWVDGSFGIGTNLPCAKVIVEESPEFQVVPALFENLCSELISNLCCDNHIRIEIKTFAERHTGLGVGTQLTLSVAKAIISFFSIELSDSELLRVSGRGGTSNLGFYNFLKGGFIVEGGHKWGTEKTQMGPGNMFTSAKSTPLIYHNNRLPWAICVYTPCFETKIYGQSERNFFNEVLPIDSEDTDRLCKYILMEIIPSAESLAFDLFCYGIEQSAGVGLKQKEISFRGDCVSNCLRHLKDAGFKGVGMSSLGPSVFGFAQTMEEAKKFAGNLDGSKGKIMLTSIRNTGADININRN